MKAQETFNQIDAMMDWEEGNLDDDSTVTLFQELVDNGTAWSLQGVYGRTAKAMIDAGLIFLPENKSKKGVDTQS
jgi:hypothetical protein